MLLRKGSLELLLLFADLKRTQNLSRAIWVKKGWRHEKGHERQGSFQGARGHGGGRFSGGSIRPLLEQPVSVLPDPDQP